MQQFEQIFNPPFVVTYLLAHEADVFILLNTARLSAILNEVDRVVIVIN